MSFELSVSLLKAVLVSIHAGLISVQAAYDEITAQGVCLSMEDMERAVRFSEPDAISF